MEIPVLLEPVEGQGLGARGGKPLALAAEGATKEEALRNLCERLNAQLVQGAEIVLPDISPPNPWTVMAGKFQNNPLFDDWLQAMADNRRTDDEQSNLP